MFQTYKDRIEFFVVYIREAHPSDGWQMPVNERQGVVYKSPTTAAERALVATDCLAGMKLSVPCLLDDMKDTVEKAYAGWPVRACLIGKDGKVVYYSSQGPAGFRSAEITAALKKLLEEEKAPGTGR